MSAPLLIPETCVGCNDSRGSSIHVRTVMGFLCGRCWMDRGMPDAAERKETLDQQAAREAEIRDAMNRRGGADRHMVRKGRT